uniref:Uncharacterized protein n=1 Tax=Rhizophora mucronata TaxID=61149 RepID=A0A2P2KAT2_RHIMU
MDDPMAEILPESCCDHTDGNFGSKSSLASAAVPALEEDAKCDTDQMRSLRLKVLEMNGFEVL